MPEGRIPLAQAVIALALAPKSNATIVAIDAAIADVQAGLGGAVPKHLRDNHGGQIVGGSEYVYPHNLSAGIAAQQYLPDELIARQYYEPGSMGNESAVSDRLNKIRQILSGSPRPKEQK
jgi:putative ATPase